MEGKVTPLQRLGNRVKVESRFSTGAIFKQYLRKPLPDSAFCILDIHTLGTQIF
jgi:hypothetical protein